MGEATARFDKSPWEPSVPRRVCRLPDSSAGCPPKVMPGPLLVRMEGRGLLYREQPLARMHFWQSAPAIDPHKKRSRTLRRAGARWLKATNLSSALAVSFRRTSDFPPPLRERPQTADTPASPLTILLKRAWNGARNGNAQRYSGRQPLGRRTVGRDFYRGARPAAGRR